MGHKAGICVIGAYLGVGVLLLQADPSGGWAGILTAYGVAAPFALLCLWQIQRYATEVKDLRDANSKLVDRLITTVEIQTKVFDAITEADRTVQAATATVQSATAAMQLLADRSLGPDDLNRLWQILLRVETKLDR